VFGMVVYFVVMRVAGYFLLRFKVKSVRWTIGDLYRYRRIASWFMMESVNSLQSFLILIFPKVYLIPAFFMSNQPLCIERFSMLLAIIITMSMVGQGIGLFFGATFDIPVASYFTPISCIPFLLVSGFMLKFNAIPSYLSWITYLSFLHTVLRIYVNHLRPRAPAAQLLSILLPFSVSRQVFGAIRLDSKFLLLGNSWNADTVLSWYEWLATSRCFSNCGTYV
jgi:hypothetical protein